VELKQLLATNMDALELREEEAAMELAEDLRYDGTDVCTRL